MFIDLRKTPEGLSSAEVLLSLSESFQSTGEVTAEFPATVSIRRDAGYFYVTVDYSCQVSMECARCCESFAQAVEGSVSFVIQSSKLEDMSDGDEDVYTYESEEDKIDFSQTVYDDCMVRVPVKPLCDIECRGFEYVQSHEVPEEPEMPKVDSRWSALTQLKNR